MSFKPKRVYQNGTELIEEIVDNGDGTADHVTYDYQEIPRVPEELDENGDPITDRTQVEISRVVVDITEYNAAKADQTARRQGRQALIDFDANLTSFAATYAAQTTADGAEAVTQLNTFWGHFGQLLDNLHKLLVDQYPDELEP
jgi:hypothetical protein